MQSQVIRRLEFPKSYSAFLSKCASVFQCELAKYGSRFKVYRMPPGITSIESMDLIDEETYGRLYRDIHDLCSPITSVCIWSQYDDENSESEGTPVSKKVKERYKYRCQACQHDYTNAKMALNACRIIERQELQYLSLDEQEALLEECRLDTVDDPQNCIPLCITCQHYFDSHKLGIDVKDDKFYWLVKPDQERVQMPHSDKRYRTIKGQLIKTPYSIMFKNASIAHRRQRYDNDTTNKRGLKRKVI